MTTSTPLKVGMRFDRRDYGLLKTLTERAERREMTEAAHVFRAALDAARTGEPLIVTCGNLMEARLMAAGYVRWGLRPPVLDQVS